MKVYEVRSRKTKELLFRMETGERTTLTRAKEMPEMPGKRDWCLRTGELLFGFVMDVEVIEVEEKAVGAHA